MKDSINRKAQQKVVETSDDRNGVVVNRARSEGDRLNKRHSKLSGRREVHRVRKFMQKVSTALLVR